MTASLAPDDELVLAALEQVWESMLFAVLEPAPAGVRPADDGLQATITLDGGWNGELRLFCGRDAAGAMAAAMLGVPDDEVLPATDVDDALGEVLNVLGGSLKSALPGPSRLGLPQVGPAALAPDPADCVGVCWRGSPVYVQLAPA